MEATAPVVGRMTTGPGPGQEGGGADGAGGVRGGSSGGRRSSGVLEAGTAAPRTASGSAGCVAGGSPVVEESLCGIEGGGRVRGARVRRAPQRLVELGEDGPQVLRQARPRAEKAGPRAAAATGGAALPAGSEGAEAKVQPAGGHRGRRRRHPSGLGQQEAGGKAVVLKTKPRPKSSSKGGGGDGIAQEWGHKKMRSGTRKPNPSVRPPQAPSAAKKKPRSHSGERKPKKKPRPRTARASPASKKDPRSRSEKKIQKDGGRGKDKERGRTQKKGRAQPGSKASGVDEGGKEESGGRKRKRSRIKKATESGKPLADRKGAVTPVKKRRPLGVVDRFPYNKRTVLYSSQSPLCFVQVSDIMDQGAELFQTFSAEEKAALTKQLPDVDRHDIKVERCFQSPQFQQSVRDFHRLLQDGCFDHEIPGARRLMVEHFNRLKDESDLQMDRWLEAQPNLSSRRRSIGSKWETELASLRHHAAAAGFTLFGNIQNPAAPEAPLAVASL